MGSKQNLSWLFRPLSEMCYSTTWEDTGNLWEVVGSLVVTVPLGFQCPCWRWAAPGLLHRPACSSVPSSWPHLPPKASVPDVIVFILLQSVEEKCTYYPSLTWNGGNCLKLLPGSYFSLPQEGRSYCCDTEENMGGLHPRTNKYPK